MRILHITDSHGTVKSPDSRTDLYYLTFLRKFAEITYLIKIHKIDMIIHAGDLFHSSRVSNKFMGQLAEIIKGYGIPMYVVPGNHDIDGYNIDTIDQTSLGLLAKTSVLTLLTRDTPLRITSKNTSGDSFTVAISGQEYYKDIDTGNMDDFSMQQQDGDINVLVPHSYIADTQQHPNIRCTYPKDIITDADIVLCGHYHRQFEIDMADVSYYNPGSMLRVEMTPYNKTHMPTYGILDITLEQSGDVVYDYQFHQFRIAQPGQNVFDFNSSAIIKQHGITLENFKTSIANSMQSINVNLGVTPLDTVNNVLNEYIQQENINSSKAANLETLVQYNYTEAAQQTIDEDVISTKGFVPANAPIYLEKIEMENYMSHEHTVIDLTKGFNIIIGESNTGKTTVFRLIKWVVDNDPLGTDFIMTGKSYVKGILTYSNGTIIERYRTLKDTGYYKVTFYDDISGQMVTNEYKGFTNNVPVEVMNAHQMPKIAITKSIETHLNVMSQLERPFLLTENTNEKAAAIGRITGTNIIDKAIKNNASEIAVNKKMQKELAKEKAGIESDLKCVPINAIKQLHSICKANKESLDTSIDKTYKLDNLEQRIVMTTDIINKHKATIKCKKIIVASKSNLDLSNSKLNEIKRIMTIKLSYDSFVDMANETNQRIINSKKVIKNKKSLEKNEVIIKNTQSVFVLYNKTSSIDSLILIEKEKILHAKNMITKKQKLQQQEDNISNVNQLMSLYNDIIQIRKKTSNLKQIVNNQQLTIASLKEEVIDTENEMVSFVLSSGKCPCCGQDITEENVTDVIKNFSV